jgi:hypothetical protein
MVSKEQDAELVHGGSDRGNLLQDFVAGALGFNHALNPRDLPVNPVDSLDRACFRFRLHLGSIIQAFGNGPSLLGSML